MRGLAWLSGGVSLALYAALLWLMVGHVMPAANGHVMPDFHAFGYAPDVLSRFLTALQPQARAVILGPIAMLDTVFPICLAVFLCTLSWQLSAFVHIGLRMLMLIAPIGFAVMDLCENVLVRDLIMAAGPMDVSTALLASQVTATKFLLLFASLVVLIVTWTRRSRRMQKGQPE